MCDTCCAVALSQSFLLPCQPYTAVADSAAIWRTSEHSMHVKVQYLHRTARQQLTGRQSDSERNSCGLEPFLRYSWRLSSAERSTWPASRQVLVHSFSVY